MATVVTNVAFLEGKKKKMIHLKVGFWLLKSRDLLIHFTSLLFFLRKSLSLSLSLSAIPIEPCCNKPNHHPPLGAASPTKMAWVEQHAMKTSSLLAMSVCQKPQSIAQSAHQGTHMCFEQRGSPSSLRLYQLCPVALDRTVNGFLVSKCLTCMYLFQKQ